MDEKQESATRVIEAIGTLRYNKMPKAEEIMDRMLSDMIANNPDEFFTLEIMKAQPEYKIIIEAMQEYGKYCAEQAWKEAIQQHSILSLSNMVNGGFVMKSPDEWWSEFQREEETK